MRNCSRDGYWMTSIVQPGFIRTGHQPVGCLNLFHCFPIDSISGSIYTYIKFAIIYFILMTPKFFVKLGQKCSLQWWEKMVYLLSVLQYIEFPWSQSMISGSHGLKYKRDCRDIKEVKPACVHPDVKEFKTGFFSFDCRPDKYGRKKGIETTCRFQPSSDGQNSVWISIPVSSK